MTIKACVTQGAILSPTLLHIDRSVESLRSSVLWMNVSAVVTCKLDIVVCVQEREGEGGRYYNTAADGKDDGQVTIQPSKLVPIRGQQASQVFEEIVVNLGFLKMTKNLGS